MDLVLSDDDEDDIIVSSRTLKREPEPESTRSSRATSNRTNKALSADQILALIPDAVLPETSDAKPFNYQDFKKNAGPEPMGDVEIPEAAENCLAGMTFVFTGIMPNLARDQAQDVVKRYGGKCTTAPSKRTTCVVLGHDAGPKKISTIKQLGIKAIDEEGFLDLLRQMPANGGSGEQAKAQQERKAKEDAKIAKAASELKKQTKPAQSSKSSDARGEVGHSTIENVAASEQLWTTRYAPKQMGDICGNGTVVKRLSSWLQNWRSNCQRGFPANAGEGSEFRAAMLYGPPGVGKTTAANLVARMQGFDVVEYNASDTRSKSLLQSHVSQTLKNTSLAGFVGKDANNGHGKPLCIIMDEVDGMSAGDRGGVGAMAAFAKSTSVPLILICNERRLPKMRPFDRVVFDMQFRRPDAGSIRNRILTIAQVEGLRVDANTVDRLVESTGSDIRQILTLLSTYARTNKAMSFEDGKTFAKSWDKEVILKPFDIVGKYLSGAMWATSSKMTLNDKMNLYYNDYDFAPLFVAENYLLARSNRKPRGATDLEMACKAADAISESDLVDKMIHGTQQQWSLMPEHAVMSCVLPSSYVAGQITGRINFPAYLGQNSKRSKYRRVLAEIQAHIRLHAWVAAKEIRLELQPAFVDKLLEPILAKGTEGIETVMSFMDDYFITKDDFDNLIELGVGPNNPEMRYKKVPTATKTAFTRKYNSTNHPVPFMRTDEVKTAAKKAVVPDVEGIVADDMEAEPEPEKEDSLEEKVTKDKYIKMPKPKAKPKAKTTKAAPKKAAAKKK